MIYSSQYKKLCSGVFIFGRVWLCWSMETHLVLIFFETFKITIGLIFFCLSLNKEVRLFLHYRFPVTFKMFSFIGFGMGPFLTTFTYLLQNSLVSQLKNINKGNTFQIYFDCCLIRLNNSLCYLDSVIIIWAFLWP